MAEKHFCKNCRQEIKEGEEIKIKKRTGYSGRYSGPRNSITYYLCPTCLTQQEAEIRAKNERI